MNKNSFAFFLQIQYEEDKTHKNTKHRKEERRKKNCLAFDADKWVERSFKHVQKPGQYPKFIDFSIYSCEKYVYLQIQIEVMQLL